jgi:hypothetical protein
VVASRNANAWRRYATSVRQFCAWLEKYGTGDLTAVQPVHVATYIEELGGSLNRPLVSLHLAAINASLPSWSLAACCGGRRRSRSGDRLFEASGAASFTERLD